MNKRRTKYKKEEKDNLRLAYTTRSHKKQRTQGEEKIVKVLDDKTTQTIEELSKIHPYGLGEQERDKLRKKVKSINIDIAQKNPLLKTVYANIIAEYIRIITKTPTITENNPEQLIEVMKISYTYYKEGIATKKLCIKLRVYVTKTQKKINKKNEQLLAQYNNILKETTGLFSN